MALHNELGKAGETAACQYLLERDYHILERNWRCHPLEVDLIADDWGELVFVEVKTRSDDRWEDPAAAVDRYKQESLSLAAIAYIRRNQLGNIPFRFDIITLVGSEPPFRIRHYINAFPLRPPRTFRPDHEQDRFF